MTRTASWNGFETGLFASFVDSFLPFSFFFFSFLFSFLVFFFFLVASCKLVLQPLDHVCSHLCKTEFVAPVPVFAGVGVVQGLWPRVGNRLAEVSLV